MVYNAFVGTPANTAFCWGYFFELTLRVVVDFSVQDLAIGVKCKIYSKP